MTTQDTTIWNIVQREVHKVKADQAARKAAHDLHDALVEHSASTVPFDPRMLGHLTAYAAKLMRVHVRPLDAPFVRTRASQTSHLLCVSFRASSNALDKYIREFNTFWINAWRYDEEELLKNWKPPVVPDPEEEALSHLGSLELSEDRVVHQVMRASGVQLNCGPIVLDSMTPITKE